MALQRGECLLREIRVNAGLTQEELSVKIKNRFDLTITPAMIGHYENDRKPINIVILRAFAQILHKKMDDFYTWDNTR
ncbi:MAG: helix-turn-helix transcriptional regulator [Candidatus Pristimantibacillus lignocellulolyticus]|uniref:Helix-turn-helix transcriptional regulator n=1 Tax=Candidatus Pristimantibacillus lignocellulolyticus TaxID=2994561 RepID=A0A9J6ZEF6_9BACL|nr:MAG: helix-turn-helix transcriptional regulator [Candidatus Pristimantibacillus lignocellulolyticus]